MLGSCDLVAFVPTADPPAAKAFYAGTLGLRLLSEDAFALMFDANGTLLRVTTVESAPQLPFTVLCCTVPDITPARHRRRRGQSGRRRASSAGPSGGRCAPTAGARTRRPRRGTRLGDPRLLLTPHQARQTTTAARRRAP